MDRSTRTDRTRMAILTAAERLFARDGVAAVTHRQISEAAGQGNTAAVNYHFGTKTELVRAIVRHHAAEMETLRVRLLAEHAGSDRPRDWVACLVQPITDHLAALGTPTWYARFAAQVATDPALRDMMRAEGLAGPGVLAALDGLARCLPGLPAAVRTQRNEMTRHLILHVCADQERALADHTATAHPTWAAAATGLIDGIVGLLSAPVTGQRPT